MAAAHNTSKIIDLSQDKNRDRANSAISFLDVSRQAFVWPQQNEATLQNNDSYARIDQGAKNCTSKPGFVFFILVIMGIVQMVQYCSTSLYVARLPGSKYVNGIVFGISEVFAMVFSGFLMGHFHDITAFRICYLIGALGYILLLSFPDCTWLPFFGITLLNMSIGGWFNTQLLILELRVPPQNVGSVAAMIRTFAVGSALAAPTISTLPEPWPLLTLASMAFFAMTLSLMLPPPG